MMKRYTLFLATCLLAISATADTKKALFLGNSLTFFNDMPQMVKDLALPLGDTLIWDSNTPQGFTLQEHASAVTSLDKIAEGGWDFVVLQEQGQIPALEDPGADTFFSAVDYLVGYIYQFNDCAIPLLYLTPARENGDEDNCADWPPVCTYAGMQELLAERYFEACDTHRAWSSPVGVIWEEVLSETDINLYDPDGIHPSLEGSYLIAATMYVAMFEKDPLTSVYEGGIDQADSQTIRTMVWDAWETQDNIWKRYPLITAEIQISGDGPGYEILVETSTYVDSVVVTDGFNEYTWFDGSSSFLFLTQTTYLSSIAYSSCTDSLPFLDSIIVPVSVFELLDQQFGMRPNPASNQLLFDVPVAGELEILGLSGQHIRNASVATGTVRWEVGDLPRGIYLVRFQTGDAVLSRRLVLD